MTPPPKTLLQFAGARPHLPALDRTVLVLIDHQREYLTGALPLNGMDKAIAETARLLALVRAQKRPVFHVVHHGRPGAALFDPDGPHAEILPELRPGPGETVVTKTLPNAFAGTNLHKLIEQTGQTELLIAGFATHMCVSTTARAALDLGYRTTIIAGATATRALPSAEGTETIPAKIVQAVSLAALADRFALIVPDTAALTGR